MLPVVPHGGDDGDDGGDGGGDGDDGVTDDDDDDVDRDGDDGGDTDDGGGNGCDGDDGEGNGNDGDDDDGVENATATHIAHPCATHCSRPVPRVGDTLACVSSFALGQSIWGQKRPPLMRERTGWGGRRSQFPEKSGRASDISIQYVIPCVSDPHSQAVDQGRVRSR